MLLRQHSTRSHTPCPLRLSSSDSDSDDASSCTSQSSLDEEAIEKRISPYWSAYRPLIESRGFRLDTYKDVKQWYHKYWAAQASAGRTVTKDLPGYIRACLGQDENDLCRDAGLPDRLFRGTQHPTGLKVVIKAVHSNSREHAVIRYLSCPSLRNHPMNHCVPVLDLIEVPKDKVVFIVMEEWSSPISTDSPYNLGHFFHALHQCIEHLVFMHAHRIAHLDVSIRNILTDWNGRYACIDYELSVRYDNIPNPHVLSPRRAEVPPELERGEPCDPFKVDVYALGVLIMHAMNLTGYTVPELHPIIKLMLRDRYEDRPTALEVLVAFNSVVANLHPSRLAFQYTPQ